MIHMDLNDTEGVIKTIRDRLHSSAVREKHFYESILDVRRISSVLFLLGRFYDKEERSSPCVILNVRSALVSQPGDLCCPGGGLSLSLDQAFARLLTLPVFSLAKWPFWPWWQKHFPHQARQMALFYAAALREGFEEMRLNPFGLTFLGCLPPQDLSLFKRVIYPQAAWINRQKRFLPNWEVDRIVYLPLNELLNPSNYARYRLQVSSRRSSYPFDGNANDFLCYIHRRGSVADILWGATFRITMSFLQIIFGFQPPRSSALPIINGFIDDAYLNQK